MVDILNQLLVAGVSWDLGMHIGFKLVMPIMRPYSVRSRILQLSLVVQQATSIEYFVDLYA